MQQHKTGPPLWWGEQFRILTKHFSFCVAAASTEADIMVDFTQLSLLEKECSMKQWEKQWAEQDNDGWVGCGEEVLGEEEIKELEKEKEFADEWIKKRSGDEDKQGRNSTSAVKIEEDSPDWERVVLNRVTDYVLYKEQSEVSIFFPKLCILTYNLVTTG